MTGWQSFFPPGTRVLALPGWGSPRLYLSARTLVERWENSFFYPASRLQGRLYRLMLRVGAAAELPGVRVTRSDEWPLGEFVRDVLPQAIPATVLVGEPSPVQKITVRLCDAESRVVGYAKYAEEEPARRRLRQEHLVLSRLPVGVGPVPLKFGPLGAGEALVSSPLPGVHLAAALPPDRGVPAFLRRLFVSDPVPLETHPWVSQLRRRSELDLDPLLQNLAGRKWSVAVQHGDLAPWNVLRTTDGALAAVDWEYGALRSLPCLDLAHFILQVSVLIYRWSPRRAVEFAASCLGAEYGLSDSEARTVVRLAAYDTHLKHLEDGYARDLDLRLWLRAVWEDAA